jgi:hypothetical protein
MVGCGLNALGGDETLGKTKSLWVAAARSRAPFEVDDALARAFGSIGRGAELPPQFWPRVSYHKVGSPSVLARIAIAASETDSKGSAIGKEGRDTYIDARKLTATAVPETCLTTVDLAHPMRL